MQTNPAVEQNKTLNGPRFRGKEKVCGEPRVPDIPCRPTGAKHTTLTEDALLQRLIPSYATDTSPT